MYKILNKLFGFDYIAWRNISDNGIARVHRGYNGEIFYWRYKITRVSDRIEKSNQVIWLTCEPKKYGIDA